MNLFGGRHLNRLKWEKGMTLIGLFLIYASNYYLMWHQSASVISVQGGSLIVI